MLQNHLLLALAWIVYCALHSWLARPAVKQAAEQLMGEAYKHYRLLYTLFAFLSLVAVVWFQLQMPTRWLYQPPLVVQLLAGLLAAGGLLLMAVCIKNYFLQLSGLRSLFQRPATTELIISGVHRRVRHPLYLGTFAFLWGLWLIWPNLSHLVANLVITVYTVLAIRWEEAKLVTEFGTAYQRYQATVPMLLPRLRWP